MEFRTVSKDSRLSARYSALLRVPPKRHDDPAPLRAAGSVVHSACRGWLLARVPGSYGGDGFRDQGLQHLLVHISELLDVETAPAGRVLAELCQQGLRVTKPGHVHNSCVLAL